MSKSDENDRESRRILDRVERESDVVGRSALARTAEKARDHLAAADVDDRDGTEVWGTRVGRVLAIIAFAGLAIWLFNFLTRAQ